MASLCLPPSSLRPAFLPYAPSAAPAFRTPAWLIAGLVPATVSIQLSFAGGYSPIRVLREAAMNPQGSLDPTMFCLAFGLTLPVPALVVSGLVGRAPRVAHILSLCFLPVTILGFASVAEVAWVVMRGPPGRAIERTICIVFASGFLGGLVLVARDLRRRHADEATLLALTVSHLCTSFLCLVILWNDREIGYFVTAASFPFFCILAFRLTRW